MQNGIIFHLKFNFCDFSTYTKLWLRVNFVEKYGCLHLRENTFILFEFKTRCIFCICFECCECKGYTLCIYNLVSNRSCFTLISNIKCLGSYFLQMLVEKFDRLHQVDLIYGEEKQCQNILLMLSSLYMLKVNKEESAIWIDIFCY